MKFMIFVKSNPGLENRLGSMSESALHESMATMTHSTRSQEGRSDEGVRRAGAEQEGQARALRGRRSQRRRRALAGDLVAGYSIWELPSIEEPSLGRALPEPDAGAVGD